MRMKLLPSNGYPEKNNEGQEPQTIREGNS